MRKTESAKFLSCENDPSGWTLFGSKVITRSNGGKERNIISRPVAHENIDAGVQNKG